MFRRKRHPGDQAHTHGLPQEIAWGTARRALSWNQLWRDIRSAVRALRRERAFAAFAIFLIGLGAGLLTAMFALVDAVTLRKLDVPDPDSLLHIVAMREGRQSPLPYALFERLGGSVPDRDASRERAAGEGFREQRVRIREDDQGDYSRAGSAPAGRAVAAASRRDDPAGPEPGGMDPHGGGAGSSVARQSRACLDRQQFGSRYNGA